MTFSLGSGRAYVDAFFNVRDSRFGVLVQARQDFYRYLAEQRVTVEAELGFDAEWIEKPEQNRSTITVRWDEIDLTLKERWGELREWQIRKLEAFVRVIQDRLAHYEEQHAPDTDDEPADLTSRQKHYIRYWTALREYLRANGGPSLMKAQPQNWMNIHIGRSGIKLAVVASAWDGELEQYGEWHNRMEFVIDRSDAHLLFQEIENRRAEIEQALAPERVIFDRRDGVRMCKVYVKTPADIQTEECWPEQYEWFRQQLAAFGRVFRPIAAELGRDPGETILEKDRAGAH